MGICASNKRDGAVTNDKSQKDKTKTDSAGQNGNVEEKKNGAPQQPDSQPQKAVHEEKLVVALPKPEVQAEPKPEPQPEPQPEPVNRAPPQNRGTINEVTDDYLQGMYNHGVEEESPTNANAN